MNEKTAKDMFRVELNAFCKHVLPGSDIIKLRTYNNQKNNVLEIRFKSTDIFTLDIVDKIDNFIADRIINYCAGNCRVFSEAFISSDPVKGLTSIGYGRKEKKSIAQSFLWLADASYPRLEEFYVSFMEYFMPRTTVMAYSHTVCQENSEEIALGFLDGTLTKLKSSQLLDTKLIDLFFKRIFGNEKLGITVNDRNISVHIDKATVHISYHNPTVESSRADFVATFMTNLKRTYRNVF